MTFFFLSFVFSFPSSCWAFEAPSSVPRRRLLLFAAKVEGPGIALARNVLGGDLECCCSDVRQSGVGTGFYRDGYCSTGVEDAGRHTVCVEPTESFLTFSKAVGNDLSTPFPDYAFPGLQPGDKWCLCASRWTQARLAGHAPKVFLKATHEKTLQHAELDDLKAHALDIDDANEDEQRIDNLRREAMKNAGLL